MASQLNFHSNENEWTWASNNFQFSQEKNLHFTYVYVHMYAHVLAHVLDQVLPVCNQNRHISVSPPNKVSPSTLRVLTRHITVSYFPLHF